MFYVIIAGTRSFNNKEFFNRVLDSSFKNKPKNMICIFSGLCEGADMLAIEYAQMNEIDYRTFPALWDEHGKKAGPIRNSQMVKYADALIAFWDGKSKGTKDVIEKANAKKIPIRAVDISSTSKIRLFNIPLKKTN